jgi:hypothetical protein
VFSAPFLCQASLAGIEDPEKSQTWKCKFCSNEFRLLTWKQFNSLNLDRAWMICIDISSPLFSYLITEILDTDLRKILEREHEKLTEEHFKLFLY